jgi:hypothetical protein
MKVNKIIVDPWKRLLVKKDKTCPVCGDKADYSLVCNCCGRKVWFCYKHFITEARDT